MINFVWSGIFGATPDLGNTIPVGESSGGCHRSEVQPRCHLLLQRELYHECGVWSRSVCECALPSGFQHEF
jgi:hypothetical protein